MTSGGYVPPVGTPRRLMAKAPTRMLADTQPNPLPKASQRGSGAIGASRRPGGQCGAPVRSAGRDGGRGWWGPLAPGRGGAYVTASSEMDTAHAGCTSLLTDPCAPPRWRPYIPPHDWIDSSQTGA